MVCVQLSWLRLALGDLGKHREVLKTLVGGLTISGKVAGLASGTPMLFPHLRWSWVPRNSSTSPRRTAHVTGSPVDQTASRGLGFLASTFLTCSVSSNSIYSLFQLRGPWKIGLLTNWVPSLPSLGVPTEKRSGT